MTSKIGNRAVFAGSIILLAALFAWWPATASAWSDADLRGIYSCSDRNFVSPALELRFDGVGGVQEARIVPRDPNDSKGPYCAEADSGSSYTVDSSESFAGTIVIALQDSPGSLRKCGISELTMTIRSTPHISSTQRLVYISAEPEHPLGKELVCLKY